MTSALSLFVQHAVPSAVADLGSRWMFRAMPQSMIPEGMVRFTHALVEDVALRSWFLGLQSLSASLRQAAFGQMSQQMRADREDFELTAAVSALARPEIYEAVLKAVRERCELQ